MRKVVVVDYDPNWAEHFTKLRDILCPAVSDFALGFEHVGSTSVPALAAKPTIDIDIVTRSVDVDLAIRRLAKLGYEHSGDLGIPGREAFSTPPDSVPHHLYVCSEDCDALRNHLLIRDSLRNNPELASAYGQLKKELADKFPNDIRRYGNGKTEFLLRILSEQAKG